MRSLYRHLLILCFGIMAGQSLSASTLKEIKEKGYLTVGLEPGFLPFEMQTQKGDYVGFDVYMMEAFAKELGVKARFVATKWDGIIPGLIAKKYDLIASGMTITPERQKAVLFSAPYYDAGLKVMIRKDLASKIKQLKDLDDPSYTLSVKLGTTGDIYSNKVMKKAKIRKLDSEADAAQSVILKKVDAFVYDKPYVEVYAASKKDQVALLDEVLSEEKFGIAARKQDQELVQRFNEFLKKWKADPNGYQKVYREVFEEMTWKEHFPALF